MFQGASKTVLPSRNGDHRIKTKDEEWFRAVARMTPMRFVKEVRLDAARTLLLNQGARASEIAFRGACESPAHFARDFKRRFGASPVRYARRFAEVVVDARCSKQ
jgi:AraC-like DNA-binding protein